MKPVGCNDCYSTWVEVDLGAIESNLRYIREHSGAQVIAIVKANAYGHGSVAVSKAALRGGAAWLGVARMEEAMELRQAGLTCPVLLLSYTPPACYAEAIRSGISMMVWDLSQVQGIAVAARNVGTQARLHVKVDTGMSRLGVQPEHAIELITALVQTPGVLFEGICTHFARADEADMLATDIQEQRFIEVLRSLEGRGLSPSFVHCANSAASLIRPGNYFTLIRSGTAMYGLHPSSQWHLPASFRPALAWKAVLVQVKSLPPGRGVSYGHEYVTRTIERIGTLPAGYADGLRRMSGNQVLIHGQPVPVVGRVCMDQAIVQLDAVPGACPGDEVVIIGSQGTATITAEDVANRWGTVNYDVTGGILARVPRIYV
ncbi:MAG: alanine racemase [Chloroflexota bacterium]